MKMRKPKTRTYSNRSTAGFTLIELLVVILVIAVLFAIAAPGWDTILSRQRISTVREEVVQAIRQTQSTARSTRSAQILVFDPNPAGIPRFATARYNPANPSPQNWQVFGNNTLQSGNVQLATNNAAAATPNSIVFDSNGTVAQPPVIATQQLPFKITIRGSQRSPGPKRCVVLKTILGGTYLAEGDGTSGCD